jgi:hypothetical protein
VLQKTDCLSQGVCEEGGIGVVEIVPVGAEIVNNGSSGTDLKKTP